MNTTTRKITAAELVPGDVVITSIGRRIGVTAVSGAIDNAPHRHGDPLPLVSIEFGRYSSSTVARDEELEIDADVRAKLAEYHVLDEFDVVRSRAYGDMAGSRRRCEINRRADRLIELGVALGDDGRLPTPTRDELRAAWGRVAAPRIARLERETYRSNTKYTRATRQAWTDTFRRLELARP